MDCHQTWYVHWYCEDLLWECKLVNFVNFWQLSAHHTSVFSFLDNNLKKRWIFTKLGIALIFWRSGLRLPVGKFCQFLTELYACYTIVVGYYRSHFYFYGKSKTYPRLCARTYFVAFHYENTPIQIYWEFYHQTIKTSRWKFLVVFIFWAEIRKIIYTPVNPSFTV